MKRSSVCLPALAVTGLILSLAACDPVEIVAHKGDKQDVNDLSGAEIFAENCTACHGDNAKGGELPGAPDLTTLAARNGGTFPTKYVMSTIDGYAKANTHGPMPEFGALLDSDIEVWVDEKGVQTPTPSALIRLAEYLQSVQG